MNASYQSVIWVPYGVPTTSPTGAITGSITQTPGGAVAVGTASAPLATPQYSTTGTAGGGSTGENA